jgi:hypothetical protein
MGSSFVIVRATVSHQNGRRSHIYQSASMFGAISEPRTTPIGSWRWAIIFRSWLLDMSSDATPHTTGKLPNGSGSERLTFRRRAMSSMQERLRIAVGGD